MAYHKSAKKRIRQTKTRTEVRRQRVTRLRTNLKKIEEAISGGDAEEAKAALRAVEPELMRGAQKGIIHRNKATRSLSRLSARVKALGA